MFAGAYLINEIDVDPKWIPKFLLVGAVCACFSAVVLGIMSDRAPHLLSARPVGHRLLVAGRRLARPPGPCRTAHDTVAGAVLFLCSRAADDIHGVALPVDRGWLAR